MYQAVTRDIRVTVSPLYVEAESAPDERRFFWSYTIEIRNMSAETVQLRTRHWHITDALGRVQEVRGKGVVGKQPMLKPGEAFEYTSGVPLATASGIMRGDYEMLGQAGERFLVKVPPFSLDSPHERRVAH